METIFHWPESTQINDEIKELEWKMGNDISNSLDNEPKEVHVFIKINHHLQRLEGEVQSQDGQKLLTFIHSLPGSQIATYTAGKKLE